MRDPSGLKAAEYTASSWPRRTAISLAVAASQMRAVLSADAVTMREPSGLKAAELTASSWPRRTAISLAVAASQMRAVLSPDAVTMREPSGLKAADVTVSSWPPRAKRQFACETAAASAAAAGEALTSSEGNARSMRVPCDASLSALSNSSTQQFGRGKLSENVGLCVVELKLSCLSSALFCLCGYATSHFDPAVAYSLRALTAFVASCRACPTADPDGAPALHRARGPPPSPCARVSRARKKAR